MKEKCAREMVSCKSEKTNTDILLLMAQNDSTVWEMVYDKYAPAMYETIIQITGDEKIARHIFTEAFLELKDAGMLSRVSTALCYSLIRKTYLLTLQHLKTNGRVPACRNHLTRNFPLIHLLCFELSTLKAASAETGIRESHIPKMLRAELKSLCDESRKNTVVPLFSTLYVVR